MSKNCIRRCTLSGCWVTLLCVGCAAEGDDEPASERDLGAATALPECPAFDYSPCDVLSEPCQSKLLDIARCLRGGDTASAVNPPIRLISEDDARRAYLDQIGPMTDPSLRHLEHALVLFGLTEPSSFEPDTAAARYASNTLGYYDDELKQITLIEHAEPYALLNGSTLLFHELVHALQDAEHDLQSFSSTYEQSVDSSFAVASLIEGEARMQERRVFASMLGLDIESLDFERSFDNARKYTEEWLFEQSELYFTSRNNVPYVHGSAYVYGVFVDQGAGAVRTLFDAPPVLMHDLLSVLWQAPADFEPNALTVPEVPAGEDAVVHFSSSLGSWLLYAVLHSKTGEVDARRLALGWRGDRLTAFGNSAEQTTAHWRIELASEAVAADIERLARPALSGIQIRRDAAALTLVAAQGTIPSWLLTP